MTRTGRPWRRALGWLALLGPFFYLSYGLANHLAAQRVQVPSVVFEWERQLPFWQWTIFPYWSVNAFYALSVLLPRDRHTLDRHVARLFTAQCVAVACFIAWPLKFSFGQPAADGLAGGLFAALRSFDQPFNQAPSLHIALVVILWDLYRRHLHSSWLRTVLHVWSFAICASVLTTWQHHFIDIPTGALLGVACVWAFPLERRASMWQAWRWSSDARRHQLARRYAAGAAGLALAAWAPLTFGADGAWTADGRAGLLLLWWPALALALVALNYAALGARGFQMDSQGRMAWAARWLFAPYRLGAAVNAWLWTRRLPAARELVPGVWIGSLPRAEPAAIGPRTTVVSLCAELQSPRGRQNHCLPVLDLVPAAPRHLRRAAARIDAAVQRGDTVLVGCALGFSRSAAAAVCWLAASGRVGSLDQALQQLEQVHPRAVLGEGWRRALEQATDGRPT